MSFADSYPKIKPEDLEKILSYLPNPYRAEIQLQGFDMSDISKQAGMKIDINYLNPAGSFNLEKPTNNQILEIYKKQYELYENFRHLSEDERQKTRIILYHVYWAFDNCNIEFIPLSDQQKVVITYSKKSAAISLLEQESLSNPNFKITEDMHMIIRMKTELEKVKETKQ